jgi:hypothetical protein
MADILRSVRNKRPDLRLHGFGLKLTSLESREVRENLYSSDSMAWSFPARFGKGDDRARSKPVAVISQTAASRFWPGEDPVGKLINFYGREQWIEIVGVVADVKHRRLEAPASADVYLPHT